jgi:hypothetical protein
MSHDKSTLVPHAPPASRRALRMWLAAAATPMAPALATAMGGLPTSPATDPDPIFAVIAEHRAHMRAWADASEAEDMAETDEEAKAANEAICAASDAFEISIGLVLSVQPTTVAGVAALLEHVGQEEFFGMSSGGEPDDYETTLTTWLNRGDDDNSRKRIAQDFPLRLAATLRSLIDRGAQS